MKIRMFPKGVSQYRDQHGKVRTRGRRKGWPTYYFRSEPGTEAFEIELRSWIGGLAQRPEVGIDRTRPGSVAALVVSYYRSAEFLTLTDSTKATYKGIIERFREEHGDKPIALLKREHIRGIIAKRANTPAAANNLLRMLRILMRFAVNENLRADDPTIGVRSIRHHTDGFHSWSEDEIAAFEAFHPPGTRARLALALLLHTGQRRGDVIQMGRQNIRHGRIALRQQKTRVSLEIPIHPELARIIAATPTDNLTFLVTKGGKPFSAAGFGNWFREVCEKAGLPKHCSAHGLRKAAARRLAEARCTPHQIAAITGHKSLREIERYTAAASQLLLADEAVRALSGSNGEQNLANPDERLAKTVDK